MTTRPRPRDVEIDAALERIAKGRRELDDQGFGHVDYTSAREVYRYILDHRPSSSEADDLILLHLHLAWESDDDLQRLLKICRKRGFSWGEIGSRLGLTRNAAKSLLDRLTAKLGGDRSDVDITRAVRQADRQATDHVDANMAWLNTYADQVIKVAYGLVYYCAEYADDDSWLHEVAQDLEDNTWTTAAVLRMSLTVAALRTTPEVAALAPQSRVHRACRAVDRLRWAFDNHQNPAIPPSDDDPFDGVSTALSTL